MSLKILEGFDLYKPQPDTTIDRVQGILSNVDIWWDIAPEFSHNYIARNGGQAFHALVEDSINARTLITEDDIFNANHVIFGFAFQVPPTLNPSESVTSSNPICSLLGSSPLYISYQVSDPRTSTEYRLQFYQGGIVYTAQFLLPGVWYYIEVDIKAASDASRHFKVYINGALVFDGLGSLSSQPFTTFSMSNLRFSFASDGYYFDDFYLLDAEDASDGPGFQVPLGPISIRPMNTASDALPSDWSSTEPTKAQGVDEYPGEHDLDVSTNSISDVGENTQMFNVTAQDATWPVIAVQAQASIRQPGLFTGSAQMYFVADDGAESETLINQFSANVEYRTFVRHYAKMPDGTAVDRTKIESAKWGFRSKAAP